MDRFHHSHNAAASSQLTRRRSTTFNSVLFILIALVLGVVFAYFGSEVAEGDSQAFDVGYQAFFRSRVTAALVATSVITGTLLVSLFKALFGRARPDPSYAEFVVSGMSFPSGHSTMSALVFLTIGVVIANTRGQLGEKIYILAAAGFLSTLVGLSRVGLGVHWATDVIAGWSFGGAWAILWLVIAHWLLDRAKRQ